MISPLTDKQKLDMSKYFDKNECTFSHDDRGRHTVSGLMCGYNTSFTQLQCGIWCESKGAQARR